MQWADIEKHELVETVISVVMRNLNYGMGCTFWTDDLLVEMNSDDTLPIYDPFIMEQIEQCIANMPLYDLDVFVDCDDTDEREEVLKCYPMINILGDIINDSIL